MVHFIINGEELEAMSGLPHIQQLTYLRGIRPYMDLETGLTGIKRRISYQSISEQLYIEPHQGIKSQSFSRDQVRRSVSGLVRAGLIEVESEGMQLVLKCLLARSHFSVQNKAAINPPQKATTKQHVKNPINTGFSGGQAVKATIDETAKAAIPHKDNNIYIFLSEQFEKFLESYPEKKSSQKAWEVFQQLNPSETLFSQLMQALENQKIATEKLKSQGIWIPNWKYPANWLAQRCWEDAITDIHIEEKSNAHRKNIRKEASRDPFTPYWGEYADSTEEDSGDEEHAGEPDNIIQFNQYR